MNLETMQTSRVSHKAGGPINAVLVALLCLCILPPRKYYLGFALGLDDAMALVLLPLTIAYGTLYFNTLRIRGFRLALFALWLTIILTGILFGLVNGFFYFDELLLPTEMWQYVKKFLFFVCAYYLAYKARLTAAQFYYIFVFCAIPILMIGVLQILPGNIGVYFTKLYYMAEWKMRGILYASFEHIRVYGVAGNPPRWGGVSMFYSVVALTGVAFGISAFRASKKMPADLTTESEAVSPAGDRETQRKALGGSVLWLFTMVALLLAIINLFFAVSRGPIAAFGIAYLLFVLIGACISGKRGRFIGINVAISAILLGAFCYFFWDKIGFLIYRFEHLTAVDTDIFEGGGWSRGQQIEWAFQALRDWHSYVIGVGQKYARLKATRWGTENEYVNLILNYGWFGMLIRYLLLVMILFIAAKQTIKSSGFNQILGFSALLGVVGYMVASVGAFFFNEIMVGVPPWLVFGWVVGNYFREEDAARRTGR